MMDDKPTEEAIDLLCERREGKKRLDARSRMLVCKLHDYFIKERDILSPVYAPEDPVGRTACALKLKRNTVEAIAQGKFLDCEQNSDGESSEEDEDQTIFSYSDMDCFKIEAIKQTIYSIMLKEEPVTLQKLRRTLKKKEIKVKFMRLVHLMRHFGFYCKELLDTRILFERNDIVAKRCKFLRTMVQVDLKKVIWVGETCFYSTCINKVPCKITRKSNMSKGGRIILLHAGNSKGWIQGAEHVIVSSKSYNFREEIGTEGFHLWFENLLDRIPNESIIVMESNFYHSQETDKPPKEHNSREEILNWLRRHNTSLNDDGRDFSKAELLGLVAETQSFYPTYKANESAAMKGHTVINLPPVHSHLNPIERIFQQVFTAVDKKADMMGGLSLNDLDSQVHLAVSNVTKKAWSDAVDQCGKVMAKYWEQEPKLQESVEKLLQTISKHMKSGKVCITKEGEYENLVLSEEESDEEHLSSQKKRIKVSDQVTMDIQEMVKKEVDHHKSLEKATNLINDKEVQSMNNQVFKKIIKPIVISKETSLLAKKTPIRKFIKNSVYDNLLQEQTQNTDQSLGNVREVLNTTDSLNDCPEKNATETSQVTPKIVYEVIYKEDITQIPLQRTSTHSAISQDGMRPEEILPEPKEVLTDIPNIPPSDDMGLFQFSIASEDSLSDPPDDDL